MTDYQLTEFAIKAQEDARRAHRMYLTHRKWMESNPGDMGGLNDVCVWQRRASIASYHALGMLAIVTR